MTKDVYFVAFLCLCSGMIPAQNSSNGETAPDGAIVYLETPSAPGSLAPNLSVGPAGDTVLLSWLEPSETSARTTRGRRRTAHALRWAKLEGEVWSEARTIVESSELFANWADFPSVVAGENGTLLAHWLQNSAAGSFGYGIRLARSHDGGETWQHLGSPHRVSTPSEYGFVSIVPEGNGFAVFWLDGRELAMGGHSGNGQMSLRTSVVAALGEELGEEVVLDADVCTCCQTSAILTSAGPAVVYRDHEDGELRDISIVRRTSEGWSEPRNVYRDSWQIGGCPVNGPAMASHGDLMVVAWFTSAEDDPRMRMAFSRNQGEDFGPALTLDDRNPLGRAAVVGVRGGAVVGWLGTVGPQAVFSLRYVTADGQMGPKIDVGDTRASRDSGFPRMVTRGDEIVLAWRETGQQARLRTAVLPLSSLTAPSR